MASQKIMLKIKIPDATKHNSNSNIPDPPPTPFLSTEFSRLDLSRPPRKKIMLKLNRPTTPTILIPAAHSHQQLEKFTLFPKLVPELQLAIWHILLKEQSSRARIIRLSHENGCRKWLEMESDDDVPQGRDDNIIARAPFPTLLHVCYETRRMALKVYKLVEGGCEYPFYINPKMDIFLMTNTNELGRFWRNYASARSGDEDTRLWAKNELPLIFFDPTHALDDYSKPGVLFPAKPPCRAPYEDYEVGHLDRLMINQLFSSFDNTIIIRPALGASRKKYRTYQRFEDYLLDEMLDADWFWSQKPEEWLGCVDWNGMGINMWDLERFERRLEEEVFVQEPMWS